MWPPTAVTALVLAIVTVRSPTTHAAKHKMNVKEDGTTFRVIFHDDGRSRPRRVIFKESGVRSVYVFDASTYLSILRVGSEKYTFDWDSNGDATVNSGSGSISLNAGSRMLRTHARADNVVDEVDQEDTFDHRRLFTCDDCEYTWETLCDNGLYTVCFWVPYLDSSSGFWSDDAIASITTMCTKFGNACGALSPSEACDGWCIGDGESFVCRGFPLSILSRCVCWVGHKLSYDIYVC